MTKTILSFAFAAILAAQPHANAVLGVGDIVSDPIAEEALIQKNIFDQLKYAWEQTQWADKLATLHNTLTTVRQQLETANLVKQAIGDPVAAIALIDNGLFSDFLQDSGITDTLTDLAGIAQEGVQLSVTIQELFQPIDMSAWANLSSVVSFEGTASFRDSSDPLNRFRAVENAYSRFEILIGKAQNKRRTLNLQIARLNSQLKNASDDAEVQKLVGSLATAQTALDDIDYVSDSAHRQVEMLHVLNQNRQAEEEMASEEISRKRNRELARLAAEAEAALPDFPASTYAKVIVDTAASLTGGRGQNPFFPTKAQIAIQTGFEVLRHMEAYVTIPNIHRLLLNEADANAAIETLMNKGDQRSHELVVAFRDGFFGQPPEQLGGVQGTLSTYLEFFINPEIAEVFCANEPTFSMDQIDDGKIVCIAMPQKFQSERLYINTILKLSYYFHALSRFDKPAEEREKDNLIILFADEGQEIITGAESAFADHRAAGVIREARATIVLATQAYTSLLGSLEKRYADVLMLNLSNELIFTCANHDSALIASKNIGEREVVEKTWGWAGGRRSYNYQRVIKPYLPAFKLRKLPKFTAIVRHCEKPFRKRLIPPIHPDGSYPKWFTRLRPDFAVRQWVRNRFTASKPSIDQ